MGTTIQQPTDLEDPLVNITGASLFRTSLPNSLTKQHSNSNEALRDPNKLLEQAKKIVAIGSDTWNLEITSDVVSKKKGKTLTEKGNERPRECRGDFGRKRARFTLMPETRKSTDTASLEMEFDPSKYREPEEFFAALDKIENAQKEIRKQGGGVLADHSQSTLSTQTRRRRQGVLRRPVNYRHLYPSSMAETETFDSSQEIPLSDSFNPSHAQSEKENTEPDNALQCEDVVANAEDKTQNILDELLSQSGDDLDDNRAITLLQERLQLQSLNIENLGLPDLQVVRRSDMNARGDILKRKSILLGSQDIFKRMSIKTKRHANQRQEGESSLHNAASPVPIGSPLAPISILYRRVSQSSLSNNPFSAENIDQELTSSFPLFQEIAKQSKEVAVEVGGDRVSKTANDLTTGGRENFTGAFNNVLNDSPAGLAVGSSSNVRQADSSAVGSEDFTRAFNKVLNDNPSGHAVRSSSNVGQADSSAGGRKDLTGAFDNYLIDNPAGLAVGSSSNVGQADSSAGRSKGFTRAFSKVLSDNPTGLAVESSSNVGQADSSAGGSKDFTRAFNKVLNDNPVGLAVGSSSNVGQADSSAGGSKDFTRAFYKVLNDNPAELAVGSSSNVGQADSSAGGSKDLSRAFNKVSDDNPAGLAIGSSSNVGQANLEYYNEVNVWEGSLGNANLKKPSADQNDRTKGYTVNKEVASTLAEFDFSEPIVEEFGGTQFQPEMCSEHDEANVLTFDNHAMDGIPGNLDSGEQITKSNVPLGTEQLAETTGIPDNSGDGQLAEKNSKNKQDKAKGTRRKTKENSRRQSLAAVGTSWKDGVRRSTRNRTRPLEYWRGERMLYGRVHSTLTTVIGVKYVNPSVEVKSYVSDIHKDLLEKAALH